MNIQVKGHKNILDLNLEIIDKKINMIFGVSGIGKSTIVSALSKTQLERDKTVGYEGDVIIKIDGSENLPPISIFNEDIVNKYVINKTDENVFDVLIDDKEEYAEAEEMFHNALLSVNKAFEKDEATYIELNEVKKKLGSPLTGKGKLKNTAKIVSFEHELNAVRNKKVVKRIETMPNGKFKWFKQGIEFIGEEQVCPFCAKKITDKHYEELQDINEFETNVIDNLLKLKTTNTKGIFDDLEITKKDIEKIKQRITEVRKVIEEYEEIYKNIHSFENDASIKRIRKIAVSKSFKYYFPDIFKEVVDLNESIGKLNGAMVAAKNKTRAILYKKLNAINKCIDGMAIPYKIKADYVNGKIVNYKIVLKEDRDELDRPYGLSNGEKSVIALILFIFECNHNNSELILIDDPASAYDDYRQSKIYRLLCEKLLNKTILLLSHSDIYAKYAVGDSYKHTARIYYCRNIDKKVIFERIHKESFGNFEDFVIERITNTSDYYQKIVNIRLLYEGSHNSIAYKYLSAILHLKDTMFVQEALKETGKSEEQVIEMIKERYPRLKEVEIPHYKKTRIDISKYSAFEKAILFRTYKEKEVKKLGIHAEMCDYAHINRKLKVCLNPYEYSFCSPKLDKYLESATI